MRLDYGTLLSFEPFQLQYGFSIISPTLKEVSKLGFNNYNYYLSTLNLDIDSYYRTLDNPTVNYLENFSTEEVRIIQQVRKEYSNFKESERQNIMPIVIYSYDKLLMKEISNTLSFFTNTTFEYSKEHNAFVSFLDNQVSAIIDLRFYDDVVDMILQRNGITKPQKEEKPKFKNKTAEKLYYRTLEAEGKKNKNNNFEIGNIISAVSAMHNSLNIANIWNITVYQLYDQFQRLQNKCIYDIEAFSVGAWGDKDNKFDQSTWYKNLNTQS